MDKFTAQPGEGSAQVPFRIDGLPVVTDESTGQAVYAARAEVELTLGGEVTRVIVRGNSVLGQTGRLEQELHFLPEEFADAGRVVQALVAAARAEWEAGR